LHIGVGEVGSAEEGGSFGRRLGQWHVVEGSAAVKKQKSRTVVCAAQVLCRRKTFAETLWHAEHYAHVPMTPEWQVPTICHKTKKPAGAGFSG
jgi:hypothetical protein